jgi:hypothetical protein
MDGLPILVPKSSRSPPYVPTEEEHASCHRIVKDLPFSSADTVNIYYTKNSVWSQVNNEKCLYYASVRNIVHFVRVFLNNILFALSLPQRLTSGIFTIKQIRSDILVLSLKEHLIGVVMVKKPGRNVLLEPTVLGELLDLMLLVEGFYGMGPVIGILTTAEEWLVSWFPVDSMDLEQSDFKPSEGSLSTASKSSSSSAEVSDSIRYSPPESTPSQISGTVHTIEDVGKVPLSTPIDNFEIDAQMERTLCTTAVMNIHTHPKEVLQLLCSAFQLMVKSRTNRRGNLSRCLLKFYKGISTVTFHPVAYDDVQPLVDFNKYPSKNVKNLVALEDLGRGSTGKAWLCVIVTKLRSSACVLKFDNEETRSFYLKYERDMWVLLYPEFSTMVRLELWSGAYALVMPHFSTVLEHEREEFKDELVEVLTSKFMKKGKVHRDICWSNIGKYRSLSGEVRLVVFDLLSVVDYEVAAHDGWIAAAVTSLYTV